MAEPIDDYDTPTPSAPPTPPASPTPSELDQTLLAAGTRVLARLVPDWCPPASPPAATACCPRAVAYESEVDLAVDLVPGDQVMIVAPRSGRQYHHHGVYVGRQHVAGVARPAVVCCCCCCQAGGGGGGAIAVAIAMRALGEFLRGGVVFARADYPRDAALERETSARLALAWAMMESVRPTTRHVAPEDCEAFATICRCTRRATTWHAALTQQLARLPPVAPAPRLGRFK